VRGPDVQVWAVEVREAEAPKKKKNKEKSSLAGEEIKAKNLKRIEKKNRKTWLVQWENMMKLESSVVKLISFIKENPDFSTDFVVSCLYKLTENKLTQTEAATLSLELVDLGRDNEEARAKASEFAKNQVLANQLDNSGDQLSELKWIRFVLKKLSERLPREMGESDDRVRNFKPDEWQRKLGFCG
jgi:hypothetical protein